MSIFQSKHGLVETVKTMIKKQRKQNDQSTAHTPRPPQNLKSQSGGSNLRLHRRRVTLSRSARKWSRGIMWSLVGLTGFSVIYGMVARIETSIEANGKLEPKLGVAKVSAPFASIIDKVLVKDGETVKSNQPLIELRDESSDQVMLSLRNNRDQINRDMIITSRLLGFAEPSNGEISPEVQEEIETVKQEVDLRYQILSHEYNKAKASEAAEREILDTLNQRINISNKTLNKLAMLHQQGAISELQVDQEKQRLLDSKMQLSKQIMLVEQAPSHASATDLRRKHVQIQEKRDLYRRWGELKHDIADVDRQLASQKQREKLLTIRSPRDGKIFDLKVAEGELASPQSPLLEVIPKKGLRARIMIPNKDIGFVYEDMPVEIRVSSYPFTEYGSIKGTLVQIGADSKSTNPNIPAEHFTAIVQFNSSNLIRNGETLPLKTGMSVTTLIKTGSRPAISLLSDKIVGLFDSVRHIR